MTARTRLLSLWVAILAPAGCLFETRDSDAIVTGTGSGGQTVPPGGGSDGSSTGRGETLSTLDDTSDSTDTGIKFDLAPVQDVTNRPPSVEQCSVVDDMNAVGACDGQAPPHSFEPVEQWSFTPADETSSFVTPLVANLTDDNADGVIDLCDVPDVVLVAGGDDAGYPSSEGHIYVLDGETGSLHFRIPRGVHANVTPAIGDLDDDGIPEIVTLTIGLKFVVFEHDGTVKWEAFPPGVGWADGDQNFILAYSAALAIANLDNAGLPEILVANHIIGADGSGHVVLPDISGQWPATTAADLDGDGDLEVVLGHAAYHHDGTLLWDSGLAPGYPQVADLDDDGLPEVLLTNANGLSLLEHTGAVIFSDLTPTGDRPTGYNWLRPATVHDFDGDGIAEFATSSAGSYTVYEADGSILWSAMVQDVSGVAAGTAFDFLGDGVPEAMFADEVNMYVFDGAGQVLLQVPRSSGTLIEYPTVADLDNDGSAEIAFVSNGGQAPTLQVIADVEDRWIQARRIWNQHAYHVTNVREDGTIPRFEPPHWQSHNTFRTNAQIQNGDPCIPRPPG